MKQAYKIGFEGSDGSGKETQTKLFEQYLQSIGLSVARISFPRYSETVGGKVLFELLKSDRAQDYNFSTLDPKAASLYYAADRLESKRYIMELISENDVVIFDRYVESNLLHQGGKFSESSDKLDFAKWLIDIEYFKNNLPILDRVVYLDLPPEISRKRAEKRESEGGEPMDAVERDIEYVAKGYKSGKFFAEKLDWDIISCVSENGYEFTPTEIAKIISEIPREKTDLMKKYKDLVG